MNVYPLSAFPWMAFLAAIFGTAIVPLSIIGVVLAAAQAMPNWLIIFVLSITLGFMLSVTLGLSALLVYLLTRNEVAIRDGKLHIKAGFFHQRVNLTEITDPRITNLGMEKDILPLKRRNGLHLPGYQVGWFTLNNKARAFVLLTARNPVVYLSTTKGFSLLLSLKEPEAFLEQLTTPIS